MALGVSVGLVSIDSRSQVPLKSISTDVTIQGFVARVEATLIYHNNEDNCMEVAYVFPMDDRSAVYKLIADINGRKIVAECQEKQQVKLAKPFVPDHDLTLSIFYENVHKPCVIREQGTQEEGTGNFFKKNVLMVNLYPKFGESAVFENGEFIFVIDRSGSMHGDRIESAKQALLYFLKSLPVGCYFNIICFGSSYTCLFPGGSECYAEESLDKALQLQASMDAYMGGTEILQPLQYVYSKGCIQGHSRQIFLLTDGGVSNADEVISLVRAHAHDTRVFTVGIGSGVSTSLVRGVARAGGGLAEFVAGTSKLQEKVVQLLKKSMKPSIADLQLDLPPGLTAVLMIPSQLPVVYSGERCILYVFTEGEVEAGQKACGRARLTGHVGTECFQQEAEIDWSDRSSEDNLDYFVHRMALKAYIKELEMKIAADSLSGRRRDIITASITANIVSKFTAFVGVDKELNKAVSRSQPLVHRSVPVCNKAIIIKTAGKGLSMGGARRHRKVLRDTVQGIQKGNFQRLQKRAAVLRSSASMHEETRGIIRGFVESVVKHAVQYTDCSQRKTLALPHVTAALKGQGQTIYPCFESSRGRGRGRSRGRGASSPGGRILAEQTCRKKGRIPERLLDTRTKLKRKCVTAKGFHSESESEDEERNRPTSTRKISKTSTVTIISMQNFDGSWTLNAQLASVLPLGLEKLKSKSPVKNDEVWATAIAISWLRVKRYTKKEEWEIIVRKAETWMKKQTIGKVSFTDVIAKAEDVVRNC